MSSTLYRSASVLGLWIALSLTARGQGYAPDTAADKMTVPTGFEVSLVVSEPVIRQPVALEFDDRGRLWVVQYLQYPNPEGLKRVEVDRWSRTKYDRVPEPPPHGPKGSDAITILEDTDGDGRADTHKNFVEGLNLCSGIAFGHGGVFVLQVPYLLFYPDADQDDVPDSDPEVLLTGFGMEDAHSVANSLTWGPDGWLYGNQGSTVTANIGGIEFQQGIWRYHPRTDAFELFCEGGGNMWGLDFDAAGHEFSSTNVGPYLMIHGVQGAYYWKSFGKHGGLHNPFAYGYFDHVPHENPAGGHVTVGGLIYDGGSFPDQYDGAYIGMNLLTHNMYWAEIAPEGSTFRSSNRGELLNSNDTWFAPSDMALGPDGALYIADWHDRRTAHPDPDADWDRSNGRVFRLAYKDTEQPNPFDLRDLSADQLLDRLDHENGWFRQRARVLLAERRDVSVVPRLEKQIHGGDPALALESLWALYVSGGFDAARALELLRHPSPDIRRWTVRFIGDDGLLDAEIVSALHEMARREGDAAARAQLAATAKRLPTEHALTLTSAMARTNADADDAHIPLLLWWALEAHAMRDVPATLRALNNVTTWRTTLGSETLLPRLIRRYAADGSEEGDRACVAMLDAAPSEAAESTLVLALENGLMERGKGTIGVAGGGLFAEVAEVSEHQKAVEDAPPVSEFLVQAVVKRYQEREDDAALLRLATRLGNNEAYARTVARAADDGLPSSERIAALEILGSFGRADSAGTLLSVLKAASDDAVRFAALDALRRYAEIGIAEDLLEIYAEEPSFRPAIRDVLFSKPNWSGVFLRAVDEGRFHPDEVPVTELRIIAHHGDEALNDFVEKHWGNIKPGTPEEKLAEMRRLNNELNFAKGDPALGKALFAENCMKCHELFGEGAHIGPGLTQANRMDREYLLVSLVDPSFLVRKEYQQFIIETKDGELYNGVAGESRPGAITIYNANAEPTTIAEEDIAEMRETDVSLMPEGLLSAFTGDDIRNLFAYIQQEAVDASGTE